MNTKEYILSGIIEAYVLGLASDEEVREVEAYAVQYAEVRQAITDFEIALENQALENAVEPPSFLKEKVLAALTTEAAETQKGVSPLAEKPVAKVVSITAAPKSVRWLRGAVAASVILLLGSAILNFYYYNKYKEYSKQYSDLLIEQKTLYTQNKVYESNFEMMNDTAVVKIIMQAANPQRTGSVATVYWNKQTQDVSLMVNNLPMPSAGKQYQLWAIVDGKPVDAGMIQNGSVQSMAAIARMNPKIQGAQAFAITLEKEGGNPTPTMEQLFVIGKV